MPRRPKAKNGLSAGERVALYMAEQEEKKRRMEIEANNSASEETSAEGACIERTPVDEPTVPKKSLQKPQHAVVRVNFDIPVGEVKPMHGMCNGPISYGADITHLFKEIGVPCVRFDCTDTAMSGYAVDVSAIFRDKYADPSDEESYDFTATDKYVEAALIAGAQIFYRLGDSCDMLGYATVRDEPMELETLAQVCINVVRHYRGSFAGGFDANIRYFELWNRKYGSSENDKKSDFEIYRRLASAVKLFDEDLKVGGLCFEGFDSDARDFVRYCKRSRAPLDFLSAELFGSDPEMAAKDAEQMSAYLKNLGMDAEIVIGKWGYVDREALGECSLGRLLGGGGVYAEARKEMFEAQADVRGAAYSCAFMLRLLSADGVGKAFMHDAQPMVSPWCAISDRFGFATKTFYAFKAFGELYRAKNLVYSVSEQVEEYLHNGIFIGAALSDSGEGYVLISSFGGCGVVDLRLEGIPENLYTADVYMLDGVKNMALGDSVPLSGMKKRLLLSVSEYGVIAVRLY